MERREIEVGDILTERGVRYRMRRGKEKRQRERREGVRRLSEDRGRERGRTEGL